VQGALSPDAAGPCNLCLPREEAILCQHFEVFRGLILRGLATDSINCLEGMALQDDWSVGTRIDGPPDGSGAIFRLATSLKIRAVPRGS
jgi:hypothetical protein